MASPFSEMYGYQLPAANVAGMTFPARCSHCQAVYDLGKVEVTARYSDCSVWKSPRCNLTVDDRGKDYVELDAQGREVAR